MVCAKHSTSGAIVADKILGNEVWFTKHFVMMQISKEFGNEDRCQPHRRRACPTCDHDLVVELSSIQWHEILKKAPSNAGTIDESLSCIWLK